MVTMRDLLESPVVARSALVDSKAAALAETLQSGRLNWVSFVESRRFQIDSEGGDAAPISVEIVIFDVEVELPQRPVTDIRRTERIAVLFFPGTELPPDTYTLREDFPRVMHTNIRSFDSPRSLCLFDEPYEEIKLRWTGAMLIERIRTWLAKTATGTLHQGDQALEFLLPGSLTMIVLPYDLFSGGGDTGEVVVYLRNSGGGRSTLVANRPKDINPELLSRNPPPFVATILQGDPMVHGVMSRAPTTLKELSDFLQPAGRDLVATLRERLRRWQSEGRPLNAHLIILINLPKTRNEGGAVETWETWAFLCGEALQSTGLDLPVDGGTSDHANPITVLEIGRRLSVWEIHDGRPGTIIGANNSAEGIDIGVQLLNPVFTLSRSSAAALNGQSTRSNLRVTAIGMGALGSQIFLNLVRSAFGEWTIVDKDFLLPHNPARHALDSSMVGWSKVDSLEVIANSIISGPPIARKIVADVMHPGESTEEVCTSLVDSEAILDFTASVAAARFLSEFDSPARRISAFLSPTGRDLVMLSEDSDREIQLTSLEMQYYRFLTREPAMDDHLELPDGQLRYARSCRDLSSVIPQELVALHAANASRAIRRLLAGKSASIGVWRSGDDGSVHAFSAPASKVIQFSVSGWTICTDEWLLERLHQLRLAKLPNETGGSLVGSFDHQRRIIYVVDSILSPADSREGRCFYIRGFEELVEQFERIDRITRGSLRHVGEWHSHPPGYGVKRSEDDKKLCNWLQERMSVEGLPGLVAIVGDGQELGWYVNWRNGDN
jgi:hypothetical protein